MAHPSAASPQDSEVAPGLVHNQAEMTLLLSHSPRTPLAVPDHAVSVGAKLLDLHGEVEVVQVPHRRAPTSIQDCWRSRLALRRVHARGCQVDLAQRGPEIDLQWNLDPRISARARPPRLLYADDLHGRVSGFRRCSLETCV